MAKRFTDTEKWERPWFRSLSIPNKLLWCYILDRCDIAGVWYVDMALASFLIGTEYNREETEKAFEKQIEISGDRWLIKDFIPFQYGSISSENKLFRSVSAKLDCFKEGASMPLKCPINGAKDKDKDNLVFKKEERSGEEKEATPEKLMELWNTKAHPNLPKLKLLTDTRKRHIKARLVDHPGKEFWVGLLEQVNRSKFLRGEVNGNGHNAWRADFDWVINPTNLAKILEGNYDNR